MEKRTPHYKLEQILGQMTTISQARFTRSSQRGIEELGWTTAEALKAIQGLTAKDFYKSMTAYNNHKVWQDVYKPEVYGVGLYVKFQMDSEGYFTISFKLGDG